MPSLPPMANSVRSVVKMSTTKATLRNTTSKEWRSTPPQIGFNLSWELGIGNFRFWGTFFFCVLDLGMLINFTGDDHDETERGKDRPPDYFDLEVFFNLKYQEKFGNFCFSPPRVLSCSCSQFLVSFFSSSSSSSSSRRERYKSILSDWNSVQYSAKN